MTAARRPTRAEALDRLARFGIRGAEAYLVDLVPLVEMIWADGDAQPEEVEELHGYVRRHVARLNGLAGYPMLKEADARGFVERFLRERPDPALLAELRALVAPLRLSSSNEADNEAVRSCLLASCLHIAARAGAPEGGRRRITDLERRTFFEILDSVEAREAR
jgi:hypothetical protein